MDKTNYDDWKTKSEQDYRYGRGDEFGPFEKRECFDCAETRLPMIVLKGFGFCIYCAGNAAMSSLFELRRRAHTSELQALDVLSEITELIQCEKFKYQGGEL